MELTVLGGNVSGISAALHLKKKCPDAEITVYEKQFWNKPCGNAISCEFLEYLVNHGMPINSHYIPAFTIAYWDLDRFDLPNPFVITDRKELQLALIEKARQEGIPVVKKNVFFSDHDLFSDQNIVATGYSGLTRVLLNRHWKPDDLASMIRYHGESRDYHGLNRQLIVFDKKDLGYGWVFTGPDNTVNVGYGGILPSVSVKERFQAFLRLLNERFDCDFPADLQGNGWGLPVPVKKNYPVSTEKMGYQFIGVGDAIGVAHPLFGAGIEPAWQSGKILAECLDTGTERINVERYRKLLVKNINKTSQRRLDRYMSRFYRSRIINYLPFRHRILKFGIKHVARVVLESSSKYPFFELAST